MKKCTVRRNADLECRDGERGDEFLGFGPRGRHSARGLPEPRDRLARPVHDAASALALPPDLDAGGIGAVRPAVAALRGDHHGSDPNLEFYTRHHFACRPIKCSIAKRYWESGAPRAILDAVRWLFRSPSFQPKGAPGALIEGELPMKKFLVAAVVIASFAAPAFAVETYFIMFDNTMKGCTIMNSEPSDTQRYKLMGKYGSKAEAETAMHSMKGC